MNIEQAGLLLKSPRSCWSQMPSWAALANGMYSADAVERPTFIASPTILALLVGNIYAEVEFRSSRSPAQSASEYPTHTVVTFLAS